VFAVTFEESRGRLTDRVDSRHRIVSFRSENESASTGTHRRLVIAAGFDGHDVDCCDDDRFVGCANVLTGRRWRVGRRTAAVAWKSPVRTSVDKSALYAI